MITILAILSIIDLFPSMLPPFPQNLSSPSIISSVTRSMYLQHDSAWSDLLDLFFINLVGRWNMEARQARQLKLKHKVIFNLREVQPTPYNDYIRVRLGTVDKLLCYGLHRRQTIVRPVPKTDYYSTVSTVDRLLWYGLHRRQTIIGRPAPQTYIMVRPAT